LSATILLFGNYLYSDEVFDIPNYKIRAIWLAMSTSSFSEGKS
jgi:hypothetical protein